MTPYQFIPSEMLHRSQSYLVQSADLGLWWQLAVESIKTEMTVDATQQYLQAIPLKVVHRQDNRFHFEGQGVNVMDLSSEMSRHGRNPVSHKLEDQKKVSIPFQS
ncbi:hypothetical protein Y1Q_0019863 [Alligator mississippiensis]|uniref:Uncharacterized protein n=1 Tax=Alligator mississippiensis TaxID=8496 RepID=A0A151PG90_ALLMI|nr:hypothetical protein Y1Q_0019863 [Alligator mississippiensis]